MMLVIDYQYFPIHISNPFFTYRSYSIVGRTCSRDRSSRIGNMLPEAPASDVFCCLALLVPLPQLEMEAAYVLEPS